MEHVIDEAAVWQRVTAAGKQGGGEAREGPAGQLAPGLLDALHTIQARLGWYRRLSRKYRLSQLISETRQEARQLRGLYLLYTGNVPPRASGEKAFQGLRQLILELERSAGRLEALSERASGETAEVLRELSRMEKHQWRVLLELMGNGGVTAASRSPALRGTGGSR
jgi:hypothetical protein